MPYVQVPKDLAKIKTKVAFNLTKRQLICFGIAGVTALPTYFLTREAIGNMGAMLLLIVVALPSFLAAMYEKNGLPFEKVAKTAIKSRFLRPKVRPYKTENLYEYAEKQYDFRDEQNAFSKSERRRMKKPLERSKRKVRTAKQTLVKKDKSRLKNMKSMQLSNTFDRFQAAVGTVRFSDNGSRGNSQ